MSRKFVHNVVVSLPAGASTDKPCPVLLEARIWDQGIPTCIPMPGTVLTITKASLIGPARDFPYEVAPPVAPRAAQAARRKRSGKGAGKKRTR